MKRTSFLIATAVAALISPSAFADPLTDVDAEQLNLAPITARINGYVADISGAASVAATGLANSLNVEAAGEVDTDSVQKAQGRVSATLSTTIKKVEGNVEGAAAAIGNTASISTEGGSELDFDGAQDADADPTARLEGTFEDINGRLDLSSTALANNISVSSLDSLRLTDVNALQRTTGRVDASLSLTIKDVNNRVDAAASAIGNSLSVSNFNTPR